MKNIIIIGAGASGMLAALTAAEAKDNHVVLLERQSRVGRKLLSTGNGRCNLTNTAASWSSYYGTDPSFAQSALSVFSPASTIEYFTSLGLITSCQYGGRVFPLSDNAGSVVDVLRYAIDYSGIELHTDCCIKGASKSKSLFSVFSDNTIFSGNYLIVACGGCAGGKLGGTTSGYELLKSFGHHCTKLYPSLVPVIVCSEYPRSLKGIRSEVHLSLYSGNSLLKDSYGELQFTEKGISGPVTFDISRQASIHGGKVLIDFLFNYSESDIFRMLDIRKKHFPNLEVQNIFTGILHNRIGTVLAKYCSLRPSEFCFSISEKDIEHLASASKHFSMDVKGTGDFDSAQVTAGGIKTTEFFSDTLESKLVPGLFACGEVLDIDAPCGGYNLQWAWSSGRLAGRLGL